VSQKFEDSSWHVLRRLKFPLLLHKSIHFGHTWCLCLVIVTFWFTADYRYSKQSMVVPSICF